MSKLILFITMVLTLVGCTKLTHQQRYIDKQVSINKPTFQDAEERKTKTLLKVSGNIPSWLGGTFIRNTPGKFNIGNQQILHWFDGFAFLAAFEVTKGKVYYQSSFLESDQYLESTARNTIRLNGYSKRFGESKAKHLSCDGQKVKTANANINLEKIGKHYLALGETPLPIEFELPTLKTKGFFDYKDNLKKANIWESAHIKRDPTNGTIYNFYIDYGWDSAYVLYKINPNTTSRTIIARQKVNEPCYMHDFSITKNYIILTAYPLMVSPIDLINPKYSFIGAHRWEPEQKTEIYIFDKQTGALHAKLNTDPMFAFHHINAFEDGEGKINIFLNAYDDSLATIAGSSSKPEMIRGLSLRKLLIDIKNKSVNHSVVSKESFELPNINMGLLGQKNQYFYAVWFSTPHNKSNGIVKYDVNNNKALYWNEKGSFASEPVFVGKPGASIEDNGVIISIINTDAHKTYLIILSAKTMIELARAELPEMLPKGLHGKFFR